MKILFIVPYPTEGASNRHRVEQYLPYLKQERIQAAVSPFLFKRFFRILYQPGHGVEKGVYFVVACLRRLLDLYRGLRSDLIFVHREACPVGPPLFEWCLWLMRKPIVFDFDDAIFLPDSNILSPGLRFLKCPWKVRHIIRMSRAVIVANPYLADYARRYHDCVHVIPTVVDTDRIRVKESEPAAENGSPVIGWIGTGSTTSYLGSVLPILEKLGRRYCFKLRIIGSSREIDLPGVPVENCRWSFEEERNLSDKMDIGIYPLPDNAWARGKAAFKAIQYMAAGLPVVASPVGMTAEVVRDGVNGFLAATDEEWFQKLSLLIEQPQLRRRLGRMGRRMAEERYALHRYQAHFLDILKGVFEETQDMEKSSLRLRKK